MRIPTFVFQLFQMTFSNKPFFSTFFFFYSRSGNVKRNTLFSEDFFLKKEKKGRDNDWINIFEVKKLELFPFREENIRKGTIRGMVGKGRRKRRRRRRRWRDGKKRRGGSEGRKESIRQTLNIYFHSSIKKNDGGMIWSGRNLWNINVEFTVFYHSPRNCARVRQ